MSHSNERCKGKGTGWEYWGRRAHRHWRLRQRGRYYRTLLHRFERRQGKRLVGAQ